MIYSQEFNKDSEHERIPARFLLGLGHHGVLEHIKDSEPHDKISCQEKDGREGLLTFKK